MNANVQNKKYEIYNWGIQNMQFQGGWYSEQNNQISEGPVYSGQPMGAIPWQIPGSSQEIEQGGSILWQLPGPSNRISGQQNDDEWKQW